MLLKEFAKTRNKKALQSNVNCMPAFRQSVRSKLNKLKFEHVWRPGPCMGRMRLGYSGLGGGGGGGAAKPGPYIEVVLSPVQGPPSPVDRMTDTQIRPKTLPSPFRCWAVITTHHQGTSRCPNISVICTLNTLIFDHKDWANLQSVENRCDSDPYQHFFEKISETIDKC